VSSNEHPYDQIKSSHNMTQFIQDIGEGFQPLSDLLKGIDSSMPDWIEKHPEFIKSIKRFIRNFQNLPEGQWIIWKELAKYGWFVNWDTNLNLDSEVHLTTEENETVLDDYMVQHLNTDWLEITDRIVGFCPEREAILRTAFDLHQKGNYIASIPLFLAQADGICAKELGCHLFGHIEGGDRIYELLSNGELTPGSILDILLDPLRSGIEKGRTKELYIDGILHGSSKYLDYGSELNSFKAFSLLAFVVFSLQCIIKNGYDSI